MPIIIGEENVSLIDDAGIGFLLMLRRNMGKRTLLPHYMELKSFLGMDKIKTQTDESIHAKTMIWFVATILHSKIFSKINELCMTDRKTFTVPSIIDLLEEIASDNNQLRNMSDGTNQAKSKTAS